MVGKLWEARNSLMLAPRSPARVGIDGSFEECINPLQANEACRLTLCRGAGVNGGSRRVNQVDWGKWSAPLANKKRMQSVLGMRGAASMGCERRVAIVTGVADRLSV